MTFEKWLGLMDSSRCCQIECHAPQRVIWPRESGRVKKFDCADYFVPQERLPFAQTASIVQFLHDNKQFVNEVLWVSVACSVRRALCGAFVFLNVFVLLDVCWLC